MRILALDGGGIRGLMPSIVLHHIEDLSRVPITDLFDMVVGTSTGAIIACLMSAPDEHGKPKYTTMDLLRVYREDCVSVFLPSTWKTLSSGYGIYGQRFSIKQRNQLFKDYLGETKLSQTVLPIVIPSFELNRRSPKIFKTRAAQQNPEKDYTIANVLGAALAAPTVFPPHDIGGRKYMDALYMKNPTLAGVAEALKHGHAGERSVGIGEIRVLSLGTGYVSDDPPAAPPLSGVAYLLESFHATVNANTVSTQYIAEQLLGKNCVRVDFGLPEKHLGICDVTKDNMAKLEATGVKVFWENAHTIGRLLQDLHPVAGRNFMANVRAYEAAQIALPEPDSEGL